MYEREKRAAAEFIQGLEFGVIFSEVFKYIAEHFGFSLPLSKKHYSLYARLNGLLNKKFARTTQWKIYALALLQHPPAPIFLSGKGGARHITGVLSRSINNDTKVLAKENVSALARILFEIEEVFEKMLKRKDVSRGCGYQVLKLLFELKKPLTIKQIMDAFRYTHSGAVARQEDYTESVLSRLKGLGLVEEKEEKFQLSAKASAAFKLIEAQREKMRAFKYRIKWFYPYKK